MVFWTSFSPSISSPGPDLPRDPQGSGLTGSGTVLAQFREEVHIDGAVLTGSWTWTTLFGCPLEKQGIPMAYHENPWNTKYTYQSSHVIFPYLSVKPNSGASHGIVSFPTAVLVLPFIDLSTWSTALVPCNSFQSCRDRHGHSVATFGKLAETLSPIYPNWGLILGVGNVGPKRFLLIWWIFLPPGICKLSSAWLGNIYFWCLHPNP